MMKTITRADVAEILYQEVGLSSFGTFALRDKKPRIGRNPKTGVEAEISSRRVISFKPSQTMRKAVNKK